MSTHFMRRGGRTDRDATERTRERRLRTDRAEPDASPGWPLVAGQQDPPLEVPARVRDRATAPAPAAGATATDEATAA